MEQETVLVKLTDWNKEPSIQDLKADFEECQTHHSAHITKLDRWNDNFNIKPLPENKENKVQSRINPKLIRKQYEWRCASLSEPFLSTPELFKVNPVSHEDKERAKQNELILNYQFQCKLNKVPFIDKLIRTCAKEGTAIIRTGWQYEDTEVEKEVPTWSYSYAPVEVQEQLQQLMQLAQTQPDTFASTVDEQFKTSVQASLQSGELLLAQQTGVQVIKETKVLVNKPTLEVCNTRNVYIDPTCEGDADKAKFIIYSFESCIADLKADGRYKNLEAVARGMVERDSPYHSYQNDGSFIFADVARKKLTVYEYFGYRDVTGDNTLTPIMASWIGSTLIRLEENPFPDKKLPFVVIPYIPELDSVYGIPDGELLEDNQKILGAVTRGVIDLLGKSANSQTGIPKGLLDATNTIRYRKGLDYEFNPTSNPQAIFQHKFPEIPQSAMWLIQQVNSDSESLSGIKAFSTGGGITGSSLGESATGVRSAMDAVSKREMSILRRIAHGLLAVGRKMLAMNAAWLSEEEVVRLTNGEFVSVRADDLAGEYDLDLAISTAEADEAKAQKLSFMLQTIGNTIGTGLTQTILSEIARLSKMPDLAYKIETYQAEPDPMQQQLQQLEMQKLQAEIAVLQSQAQENAAKAQVHGAKVGVEQARAENLQSDADLKTQDFVQNQSGEKHLRDLDKQTLINQGAIDAERVKGSELRESQKIKHNGDLLKAYADSQLNPKEPTRQNY